ncbi:beta-defensin 131A-like [Pan troglodytes]|uniref:beta-defensin 131A-like n=1 Tax=Pan troglodytes TaxID=9598 RepID=UPI0023F0F8E5|nr:beta-defensin 131A-like [Pan troglodytes]
MKFDDYLLAFYLDDLFNAETGSFISNDECPSEYYHCRLKCNADEHAIRHCADFSICCKLKIIEIDGQKKW